MGFTIITIILTFNFLWNNFVVLIFSFSCCSDLMKFSYDDNLRNYGSRPMSLLYLALN